MRTYAVIRNRRERDGWLRLAEQQRRARQHERDRELLGSRALSAQIAEYACGTDASELAELLAWRIDGDVSI